MIGLLGKKLGHTRVYDTAGNAIAVTVVLAGPNRVLQVKSKDGRDGYNAVQLGFDDQKQQRLTKAVLGHITKHKGAPVKRIREFRDFSLPVKPGDVVGIKEKDKSNPSITSAIKVKDKRFSWLDWNETEKKGTFITYPEREAVPENIKEQLIVELYSK